MSTGPLDLFFIGEIIHSWNCNIENIELQFLAKVFRFHMKSIWNLADFMKSVWNPVDFMKSVWNLADFRWNPVDFMKSGRFQVKSTPNLIKSDVSAKTLLIGLLKNERPILDHHAKAHNFEIQQISWNLVDFMWNLADFMKSLIIAPTLHSSNWRVFAETLAFIILGGFHRWNLGELCWISQVKSLVIAPTLHSSNWRVFAETLAFIILGGFHRWNLGEICQISWVKSTRFQGEIPHPAFIKLKSFCWNTCFYNFGWISQVISGWNPLDFTGQICQISGWTLLDFTSEILGHSPYPAFIKLKSFLLKHLLL